MLKATRTLAFLSLWLTLGHSGAAQEGDRLSDPQQLVRAEREFCKLSVKKGMREAFLAYLADDGVLFRPGPVNGKKWMSGRPASSALLTWEPIAAEVSQAGDLGYTTGPWEFRGNGPDDREVWYGNYVTIWKRQSDGEWKVFLDIGTGNPPPSREQHVALSFPGSSAPRGIAAAEVAGVARGTALLERDSTFSIASLRNGTLDAYRSHLADSARFFREGSFPVIGKDSICAILFLTSGKLSWRAADGGVSRSGDLGYTYGEYQSMGAGKEDILPEKGNYVRIWRRVEPGRWTVALDIAVPMPQPEGQVKN